MLKQNLANLIAMSFFLLLNKKLTNNIESFLPEKRSIRKTSKHWVDNEMKNAISKNTGKTGTTEARSKF